jgi:hypothetical protein
MSMAESLDPKMKKEWVTKALGGLNLSPEEKISDAVLDEEAVILIDGTNVFGDPIYSYVKISLRNFKKLRDVMIAGTNFSPSDFGEVLMAGRGEPSQEVKDEMRIKYKMVDIPRPPPPAAFPQGFSQPKFFNDEEL